MLSEEQYEAITPIQTNKYINYDVLTDLDEPVPSSIFTCWDPPEANHVSEGNSLYAPELFVTSCGLEPYETTPYPELRQVQFMNEIPSSPSRFSDESLRFTNTLNASSYHLCEFHSNAADDLSGDLSGDRSDDRSDDPRNAMCTLSIQSPISTAWPQPKKRVQKKKNKADNLNKPLSERAMVLNTPQKASRICKKRQLAKKASKLLPAVQPVSESKLKTPSKASVRRASQVYKAGINGGLMSTFGVETPRKWKPFDGTATKELFGYIPSLRKYQGDKPTCLRLFAWRPQEP